MKYNNLSFSVVVWEYSLAVQTFNFSTSLDVSFATASLRKHSKYQTHKTWYKLVVVPSWRRPICLFFISINSYVLAYFIVCVVQIHTETTEHLKCKFDFWLDWLEPHGSDIDWQLCFFWYFSSNPIYMQCLPNTCTKSNILIPRPPMPRRLTCK